MRAGRALLALAFVAVTVLPGGRLAAEQHKDDRFRPRTVFESPTGGWTISYPALLAPDTLETGGLSLTHTVPFRHTDPCDFRDEAALIENLTDLRLTVSLAEGSLRRALAIHELEEVASQCRDDDRLSLSPGFIDSLSIGHLQGYRITSGAEGCGEYRYYFPLDTRAVLFVRRDFITELQPIIKGWQDNCKLPGVIPPEDEERLFGEIVGSFDRKD